MSEGNYGGNGSIWWQVAHTSNGSAAALRKRSQVNDANREHWVDDSNDQVMIGHDPSALTGMGPSRNGSFHVALRFSTQGNPARRTQIEQELRRLSNDITKALQDVANSGEAQLSVEVPAINRPSQPGRTPGDGWEVSVKW
jgi:hypothetical protein